MDRAKSLGGTGVSLPGVTKLGNESSQAGAISKSHGVGISKKFLAAAQRIEKVRRPPQGEDSPLSMVAGAMPTLVGNGSRSLVWSECFKERTKVDSLDAKETECARIETPTALNDLQTITLGTEYNPVIVTKGA